jgi:hypothetical protein
MRKILLILASVAALSSCAELPVASTNPAPPAYDNPVERLGTLVGTFGGPDGEVHMKPGYDYDWETVYETDDYGRVYARRNMYLTYKGRRITD